MNTNNNFNIGKQINKLRKEKGLSQEQLALKAEITPAYLGMLERNAKNPTIRVLGHICDALEISFSDFFSPSFNYTPQDQDNYTIQILAQIGNCTEAEKKILLKALKDILTLRNLPK